jgi:hypothetical protein
MKLLYSLLNFLKWEGLTASSPKPLDEFKLNLVWGSTVTLTYMKLKQNTALTKYGTQKIFLKKTFWSVFNEVKINLYL